MLECGLSVFLTLMSKNTRLPEMNLRFVLGKFLRLVSKLMLPVQYNDTINDSNHSYKEKYF